ncbi:hypothetical protein JYK17_17660 [Streptomyces sp. KC 17012]|uniref:hypothetical protein n=1 Tax=Streptomyces plumbidurans TaxID=2814589 RepID=UPI001C9DB2B5|nr:hypothetical protein [Streptomyces plumbidurans]MBY8341858.1 hypothetical protein [Streptomyces plumbidurans]
MSDPHARTRMTVLIRADIAAHVRVGRMDRDIVRLLGVAPAAVTAVRRQLHIPCRSVRGFRPRCLEDAFWGQTRHRPDGHLQWLGTVDDQGNPVLWHSSYVYSARRIAYRFGHGTEPSGPVTVDCDQSWCVEPTHLIDEPTRTYLTGVLTALFGGPTP